MARWNIHNVRMSGVSACVPKEVVHSEDFLCDATLKGEFVRVVSAAEDLDEAMKAKIMRCGLRGLATSAVPECSSGYCSGASDRLWRIAWWVLCGRNHALPGS